MQHTKLLFRMDGNSQQELMFIVVEFKDGVQIIPSNWSFKENNSVLSYWPPIKDKIKINKLISSRMSPNADWETHTILREFCRTCMYSIQLRK